MKTKAVSLRMPLDLLEWIENLAEKEHRSTSSQIIYMLKESRESKK